LELNQNSNRVRKMQTAIEELTPLEPRSNREADMRIVVHNQNAAHYGLPPSTLRLTGSAIDRVWIFCGRESVRDSYFSLDGRYCLPCTVFRAYYGTE